MNALLDDLGFLVFVMLLVLTVGMVVGFLIGHQGAPLSPLV